VHFDAKVTNSAHHHWFSGDYSEKTDSHKTDQMVEHVTPPPNYGPVGTRPLS